MTPSFIEAYSVMLIASAAAIAALATIFAIFQTAHFIYRVLYRLHQRKDWPDMSVKESFIQAWQDIW